MLADCLLIVAETLSEPPWTRFQSPPFPSLQLGQHLRIHIFDAILVTRLSAVLGFGNLVPFPPLQLVQHLRIHIIDAKLVTRLSAVLGFGGLLPFKVLVVLL